MKTIDHNNIMRVGGILVTLFSVLAINVSQVSAINQASNQQKTQILRPEDFYGSVRGAGFLDSSKITGSNGGAVNLVEANGNSKRARKISTFMPMRGRKNGSGPHGPGTTLDNLMNAYSIVPLIKMRMLESVISRQQERLDKEQQSLYNNDNENLQSQYDQQQQQQQDRSIGTSGNMNQYLDMDESMLPGNSQSSQFIQNKLRRAFLPMRGKKSIMDEIIPAEASLSDPLPTIAY